MQCDRADDGEEGGVAGHLEAELDGLLQRDRRQAGDGADPEPVGADAGFLHEPPAHGDEKAHTDSAAGIVSSRPPSAASCR